MDLRSPLLSSDRSIWSHLTAHKLAAHDPIVVSRNELTSRALFIMKSNRRKRMTVLPMPIKKHANFMDHSDFMTQSKAAYIRPSI